MKSYKARVLEQLDCWVDGVIDDECCPDFSCCEPDLYQRDETVRQSIRERFLKNNPGLRKEPSVFENRYGLFGESEVELTHPVVHGENGKPVYCMPHTDEKTGYHPGGNFKSHY